MSNLVSLALIVAEIGAFILTKVSKLTRLLLLNKNMLCMDLPHLLLTLLLFFQLVFSVRVPINTFVGIVL